MLNWIRTLTAIVFISGFVMSKKRILLSIMSILVMIGLIDCTSFFPPPGIYFNNNSAHTRKMHKNLDIGSAELILSGKGREVDRPEGVYLFILNIELKVSISGDWRVHPENVKAFLEGNLMALQPLKGPSYPTPLKQGKKYKYSLEFFGDPPLKVSGYNKSDSLYNPHLTIVLDKFLQLDGEFLEIERFDAVDIGRLWPVASPMILFRGLMVDSRNVS